MSQAASSARLPGRRRKPRSLGGSTLPAGLTRALAVASVAAFGAAALSASSTATTVDLAGSTRVAASPGMHRLNPTLTAARGTPRPRAVVVRRPPPPAPPPPAHVVAAPAAAGRRAPRPPPHIAAAKPYVPAGTGMWI